jgi:methylenetetrahydrofolate dehydrogenase (NADP+)/methenyltetrahydrofolate cyclohydrolase
MSAKLLDGKALGQRVLAGLGPRVERLRSQGVVVGLRVVRVGDDPASKSYVSAKLRACAQIGIAGAVEDLAATVTASVLEERLAALNCDPAVHGILVQLPLPPHLDEHAVAAQLDPGKDVDGFHPQNLGRLLRGDPVFRPCTPAGVLRLIDEAGIALHGKHAVVVGRSEIVGKPMSLMLLERDATVTVCHSKTDGLVEHTREADVLIVATGRAEFIVGSMVKPGAVVIDVGVNRRADGRLVGDVEAETVLPVASYLTPVPGGVGPMTVAMLMENTVNAADLRQSHRS